MSLEGKHLIGWATSCDGDATFSAVDPADGSALAPSFTDATSSEIDRALELAEQAHETPVDSGRRADFLDQIAEQLSSSADELTARATKETGLPEARIVGERGRTEGQLRAFARVLREGSWVDARIDPALPERAPLPRADLRRMLVPLGPVAVFGASNFPLAFSVAGGDTASALAAGCPVVAKGHPYHPGTSELVGRAITTAARTTEMPEGTFSLVQGHSHRTGRDLVQHPTTRAVAFTGSLAGGRALADLAAARPCPIPVFAEMGSSNPVFLLEGALDEKRETIAQGLCGSLTLGIGQFCTNPGLLVLVRSVAQAEFLTTLASLASQAPSGVMLHPAIASKYREGVERLRAHGGLQELTAPRRADDAPATVFPAVFSCSASEFMSDARLSDEVFGPCTLAVICDDAAQAIKLARSLAGQLTASLHASEADAPTVARLAMALRDRVGRLVFNGFPTGVEVCPAMQHGGPYPASSDSRSTSVGTAAIQRFARPVCWQDAAPALLPRELADENPLGLMRLIDGELTRAPVGG